MRYAHPAKTPPTRAKRFRISEWQFSKNKECKLAQILQFTLHTIRMEFRNFITESSSYESDINKTLKKLPNSHRKLIEKYKFNFQPHNGLKGDSDHIGVIDPDKKTITIAAPWNYSRELTLLHEVGHLLWEILPKEIKNKWKTIVENTKMKKGDRQNPEELFCMSYSNYYVSNPVCKFDHPSWKAFIKNLPH